MGTFDYERLKNTVNNFSYNLFNFPADFSKSVILENSYDGMVYEKRTTETVWATIRKNQCSTKWS